MFQQLPLENLLQRLHKKELKTMIMLQFQKLPQLRAE